MAYLRERGAPEVEAIPHHGNDFYWQAFHYLRGSRPVGFGLGPIPMAAIMEYAAHCGMDCPVSRTRLLRIIMRMDNVERDAIAERSKS